MLKFITAGIMCGLFSGVMSRFILKKAIRLDNQSFFIIWGSLCFCRLLFLVLSVFLLRVYGLKTILCFVSALIIIQEIFLLVPIVSSAVQVENCEGCSLDSTGSEDISIQLYAADRK